MAASPEAVTRALLSGALQKANDAVHADEIQDWEYAINAYIASCELLGQVIGRIEVGSDDWNKINAIVCALNPFQPLKIKVGGLTVVYVNSGRCISRGSVN